MPVTTWSFGSGFESWTFVNSSDPDDLPAGKSFCAGCIATRTHVPGAIRNTIVVDSLANVTTAGNNFSPTGLNATIVNLDTIEVDISATSDFPIPVGVGIIANYTDDTTEFVQVDTDSAQTVTLTMTQSKTLDFIKVRVRRSTGGSAEGSTHFNDILEVRLTTATEVVANPGQFFIPADFIASGGAGAFSIASASADGLNIYIALFNSLGFPTLVKILKTLDTDGSIVFNPGGGSAIGVRCGRFNDDVVWVAGSFDGTNTVEKSENAGTSFSAKDNATMGNIRAFTLGPSSDETVIVFDETNGDILETIDDGAIWTTINASVTPEINAIARLDKNTEECVFGNEGGATDSIDYSVNSGANLEDFQTGVFPNVDVTGVRAN